MSGEQRLTRAERRKLDEYHALVEQLRREHAMERLPLSQTVAELISFVLEQQQEDPALVKKKKKRPDNGEEEGRTGRGFNCFCSK